MKIDKEAKYVVDKLLESGYKAYIVGGCVRDMIMDREPKDWDITTNALPEQIKQVFERTIDTGIKHGTVTVRRNHENYEVTTFRIDGEYKDNRRPEEVFFTDLLEKDLSRRDFTINAMAYNSNDGIVDYFNGQEDIKSKRVHCVGDPLQRFEEDALRIMRGIRFATRFDFSIEEETFKAMGEKRDLLRNISSERIRDEFVKILMSSKPSVGINLMLNTGVLEIVLPELIHSVGFDQKNENHDKCVYNHILSVLDHSIPNLIVRLAALFHDIGKPFTFSEDENGIGYFHGHEIESEKMCIEILKRLKFDNKTVETVALLTKEHMDFINITKKSAIKKLIGRIGVENLENLLELKIADIKGTAKPETYVMVLHFRQKCNEILETKEPFSLKELEVNGHDLVVMGYRGAEVGKILNYLLELVIEEPEINKREILLAEIEKLK